MYRRVFLCVAGTKLGLMCFAQGHNAVTPVRRSFQVATLPAHIFIFYIFLLGKIYHFFAFQKHKIIFSQKTWKYFLDFAGKFR